MAENIWISNAQRQKSVILNKKTKTIIAFSPPKSLSWVDFTQNNTIDDCVITKFEEGTMINLFYDKDVSDWEISTKSSIGGRYKYFKERQSYNTLPVLSDNGKIVATQFDFSGGSNLRLPRKE